MGRLLKPVLGLALFVLCGCDVASSARSDFQRLTGPTGPFARAQAKAPQATPATRSSSPPTASSTAGKDSSTAGKEVGAQDPAKQEASRNESAKGGDGALASLVGKDETQIRALLGPPNSEEDRAPGKTWHYREGQCSVDIQFYPDIQTRQFGSLAYEVRSDDGTDEGKRLCLGQLRSRAQTGGG